MEGGKQKRRGRREKGEKVKGRMEGEKWNNGQRGKKEKIRKMEEENKKERRKGNERKKGEN